MSDGVTIRLVTDDRRSEATRDQLGRILATHDLSRWLFTRDVDIDARAIPHSHPVLTLHTRHLERDDLVLATFLHEQLHWYLVGANQDAVNSAFEDLRALFPSAPVGFPDGAIDEESTYLHLIVNYLEGRAVAAVLGEEAARIVLEHWTSDHYCWIYRTVLDHGRAIHDILERHRLLEAEL
jgi:hypothetical protein